MHVAVPVVPHEAHGSVVPGEHIPVHWPALHMYGHALPFCQAPVESQRCGVVPEHCVALGEHIPVQAPAVHRYGQEPVVCQVPPEVQVCVEVPEHCLLPGVHAPAHTPELQTLAQGAPLFCQAPDESQT